LAVKPQGHFDYGCHASSPATILQYPPSPPPLGFQWN
jgi:hypothetical protein